MRFPAKSIGVLTLTMTLGAGAPPVSNDVVLVPGTAALYDIVCRESADCIVVGDDEAGNMVVVPISHGVPGSPVAGPAVTPSGLTCVDAHQCIAVGSDHEGHAVVVPIRDGVPGQAREIPGAAILIRVTCAGDGACTAVGTDESFSQGVVVADVQAADASAVPVPGSTELLAVVCPGHGPCLAVGLNDSFQGIVVPIADGAPGTPIRVDGINLLTDITCVRADVCMAVGGRFGRGFSMVSVPIVGGVPGQVRATPEANDFALGAFPLAVECPAARLCVSVGQTLGYSRGAVAPVVRGKPSILEDVLGTRFLGEIACDKSGACLAVGSSTDSTQGVLVPMTAQGAPATTTLTATESLEFGQTLTFAAEVSAPNGHPRGQVFFGVDGLVMDFPRALDGKGRAAFTVDALAPGAHTITADYVGNELFPDGISPAFEPGSASIAIDVRCSETFSGPLEGDVHVDRPGVCITDASVHGSVIVGKRDTVAIESSSVAGSITAERSGAVRVCGSTVGGDVIVRRAKGMVLVGDRTTENNNTACTANNIEGRLVLEDNKHGVKAVGNTVGSIEVADNSGVGPYAFDLAPFMAPNVLAKTGRDTFLAPPAGASGEPVQGVECQAFEQFEMHVHSHLAVFADGQPLAIPGSVGQVPPLTEIPGPLGPSFFSQSCYYWLHTHDETGTIHLEGPFGSSFTLGQLFAIWGQPLDRTQVGPRQGTVTAFVDGRRFRGDPRDIPLGDHTQIQLDVGKPVVPPQPFEFTWNNR